MRNEITDLLLDELQKYGIEGNVDSRTKHLEVWWIGNHGRRFVIAAKTASDWRAAMNVRSDMRKILRQDEQELEQKKPTAFSKAMALPKLPLLTTSQRELILQKDVELLSELVFELQVQNNELLTKVGAVLEKMNSITVTSTVVSNINFSSQSIEKPSFVAPSQHQYERNVKGNFLPMIPFEWTHVSVFLQKMNAVTVKEKKTVYTRLQYFKRIGKVEHGTYGMWRRVPNDNIVVLGSGEQSSA